MQLTVPARPRIVRAKFDDFHPWEGIIRVAIIDEHERDPRRRVKGYHEFHNLITDDGKDYFSGLLGGINTGGITWVAVGTSGTSPAAGDHTLGAEVFRKAVTKTTQTAGTKNLITVCNVASYEINGTVIAELGWFAGPSATSSANTGILIAHTLYSHTKLSSESLSISRTDQF